MHIKTKLKSAVSMLLSAAMVMSNMSGGLLGLKSLKASAASATVSYNGQLTYDLTTVGNFTINGQRAFCLQHQLGSPHGSGTVYNIDTTTANGYKMAKALYYLPGGPGWNSFNNTYKYGETYAIVYGSLALSAQSGVLGWGGTNPGSTNGKYQALWNNLMLQPDIVSNNGIKLYKSSNNTALANGTSLTATTSGNYNATEWITLGTSSGVNKYSSGEKANYVVWDLSVHGGVGMEIKSGNNTKTYAPGSKDKVTINIGDQFRFIAGTSTSVDKYTFTAKGQAGYKASYVDFGGSYQRIGYSSKVGESSTSLNIKFTPTNGAISISKTDQSGNKLANVRFNVYKNNNKVASVITDANGVATYGKNSDGTYTLKAGDVYSFKEAPRGQQDKLSESIRNSIEIDETERKVTVVASKVTSYSSTVKNTLNGAISWTKYLDSGTGTNSTLSGIKFNIYSNSADANANTNPIGYAWTDSKGKGTFGTIPKGNWKSSKETQASVFAGLDASSQRYYLPVGSTYYVKEAPIGDQTVKDIQVSNTVLTIKVSGAGQITAGGSITNKKLTAFTIKKTDSSGKALSGVEFAVSTDKNAIQSLKAGATLPSGVKTYKTNSSGEAVVGGTKGTDGKFTGTSLVAGTTYYVKEYKLPNNEYILDDTVYSVTLKGDASVNIVSVKNITYKETYGAFRVYKTDQNGNALAGIKFNVYSDAELTNKVSTITTDKSGYAVYGLNTNGQPTLSVRSRWYIKEAPLNEQPESLRQYLTLDTKTYDYTVPRALGNSGIPVINDGNAIVNVLKGAISINKVDAEGNALSNIKFNIYSDKECTKLVASVATDKSGNAIYGLDDNGDMVITSNTTYYVREASANEQPEEYRNSVKFSDKVYEVKVTVGENTAVNNGPIVNETFGALKFTKENRNGKPLAGISFDIYTDKECTKLYGSEVTDASGVLTYGIDADGNYTLPVGTYYLRESKEQTPEILKYVKISNKVYTVEVNRGQVALVNDGAIVNETYGALEITKVDQNGEPIKGVTFNIYMDNVYSDNFIAGTMTTDENGYASYGFDGEKYSLPGDFTYYVKEADKQSDEVSKYVKNSGKVYEVFVAENAMTKVNNGEAVVNQTFGAIDIKKVDTDGNALAGVRFDIYSDKECTKLVTDVVTDTDGYAVYGLDADKNFTLLAGNTYYVRESTNQSDALNKYVGFDTETVYEVTVVRNTITSINDGKPITNKLYGAFSILKVDEDEKPINGVTFTVYSDKKLTNKVTDLITDAAGSVSYGIDNGVMVIEKGTKYYVKETAVPDSSIKLSDKVYEITIEANKNLLLNGEAIVNEYKTGELKVYKHGKMFTSVTSADGAYTPIFEDKELSNVSFNVYAAEDIKTFTGTLKWAKDSLVDTIKSDETGYATLGNIPVGKYYVIEVGAPTGYVIDTTRYDVTAEVNNTGAVVITGVDVHNIRGQIAVTFDKEMIVDGVYVKVPTEEYKDVKFGLFSSDEKTALDGTVIPADGKVAEAVVSAGGNVTFDTEIPFGKYYVQEIATNEGYILDDTKYDVELSANSINAEENVKVTLDKVTNLPILGDIDGNKIADTGEAVEGAIFGIFYINEDGTIGDAVTDADGNKLEATTDKDGKYAFGNVPFGSYIVKEVKAPDDYKKNPTENKVTILENGQVVRVDTIETHRLITINTSLTDGLTKDHISKTLENTVLNDEIVIEDLIPGRQYKVELVLIDKETGEEAVDATGNVVKVEKTFTAPESEDEDIDYVTYTDTLTYQFNATDFGGKTFVSYASVVDLEQNKVVSIENDPTNEKQTVTFPTGRTTLLDGATKNHIANAAQTITLVDTVSYTNLLAGKTYKVTGTLMDKATGEALLIDGKPVVSTAEFTPAATEEGSIRTSGTVDITFVFNGSELEGKTVVAFEDVTYNDVSVFTHADIDDEAQTVDIPKVRTTAKDSKTDDHIAYADNNVTIIDNVAYENVLEGENYTVVGTLVNSATGEAILGADGNPITSSTKFTANGTAGFVEVSFTFDASDLKGVALVVTENLYDANGVIVGSHNDLTDKSQTIKFVDGGTTALGKDTNDHTVPVSEQAVIVDTVEYVGLLPEKEYTLTGYVMVRDGEEVTIVVDGEELTGAYLLNSDGTPVTNTITFTTPKAENGEQFVNGSVDISFIVDSTQLEGKTVVVFEDVYYNGVKVFTHADINDEGQSIRIITLKTTAIDSETKNHISLADKSVTIIDTVVYTNLTVGKEYTVTGVLMDKATGKAMLTSDGKEITASKTFVAESENGSVDIAFVFDGTTFAGKTVVAFETISSNGVDLATHADITDEAQTVQIVKIRTTATDKADGDKKIEQAKSVTIVDEVKYENLIAGKEYTLVGTVMDKSTGKALVVNGKTITNTIKFTPETSDGTVTMEFTFDASAVKGGKYVVFENLKLGEVDVAVHNDLEDEGQSVEIVTTTKVNTDSPKTGDDSNIVTVISVMALAVVAAFALRKKRED